MAHRQSKDGLPTYFRHVLKFCDSFISLVGHNILVGSSLYTNDERIRYQTKCCRASVPSLINIGRARELEVEVVIAQAST